MVFENETDSLSEAFDNLFWERANGNEKNMTDTEVLEYELCKEKIDEITNYLKKNKHLCGTDLWLELDSAIGSLQVIIQKCSYRRGIKDGIGLTGGVRIFGLDYTLKPAPLEKPQEILDSSIKEDDN